MHKTLCLLLLSCMFVRAGDVKVREVNPDTGCPIYEEGEIIPPGVSAHIRRKDGSFLSSSATIVVEIRVSSGPAKPEVTVEVAPKVEIKEAPLSIQIIKQPEVKAPKVREVNPDTGYPIYEEGEIIPPGVTAHIRRKDGSFLSTGGSAVVEIRNSPLSIQIIRRKQFT